MASKMFFKRGDDVTHYFIIPASSWSAGGTLFFTAKPDVDDDVNDTKAVINRSFSDAVAVNDGVDVTYTCTFPASDTTTITAESEGDTEREFVGEFQYVSNTGKVTTFPGTNDFIQVIVYFDIRRRTV